MEMPELKPCPFCGEDAEVLRGKRNISIQCINECVRMSASYDDYAYAMDIIDDVHIVLDCVAKAWNTRAAPQPDVPDIEGLKDEAIRFAAQLDKPIMQRKKQSDYLASFIDHLAAKGFFRKPHAPDKRRRLEAVRDTIELCLGGNEDAPWFEQAHEALAILDGMLRGDG